MEQNWKTNGPLIIGGVGGSGTRLVTEICQSLGYNLGDDLNESLDNLAYTLLFRRYHWYVKNQHKDKKLLTGLNLLEKLIKKNYFLSIQEIYFLLYSVADTYLHYRDDKKWAFIRIQNIFQKPKNDYALTGWGWKEPNSYLLLPQLINKYPKLKFIHIIRHGLDMALSKNQRQMKNWSGLFFTDWKEGKEATPEDSLRFWIAANNYIKKHGSSLGPAHYLQINFDQLCTEPELITRRITDFLDIKLDQQEFNQLLELPKSPPTIGRYKNQDLSVFHDNEIQEVIKFGFQVENEHKQQNS